ncbi:hypothetical protein JXA34_03390 [Patescibacteria group bacterium]|nr:hypothetical protein [Patescibacteria group bacterium]
MEEEKVRATIKIDKNIKQLAEKRALDLEVTFQDLVNTALYNEIYSRYPEDVKSRSGKLRETAKPIDEKMGDLTRSDFYD